MSFHKEHHFGKMALFIPTLSNELGSIPTWKEVAVV
jgi:hypothetical protein